MTEGLEVRVLGPAQVIAEGSAVPIPRRLERALVVRLALARGRGVPDDALARDLWGEVDDPAKRLRVLVHRLRQALGAHAVAVQRTAAGYAVDALPTDLIEVEQARNASDPTTVRKALDRWRGPSLVDLREVPFAATEGARLDNVRLDLQADLAEAELGIGTLPTWLDELVTVNPLHERLVGLHAITLYRTGRQADALACLDDLRTRLADELGVDPQPGTAGLHVRLLRQDPALLGPDRGTVRRGPVFVGRAVEMSELTEALQEQVTVTLVGGPGVGKTRLAREIADAARRTRRVAWVDLAPLTTRAGVVAAVATAAGVDPGPGDPLPRCREALTGALLVLDNAEHLTGPTAEIAGRVGCSVLITSQTATRAPGEVVRQIGSLSPVAASTLFVAQSGASPGPAVDKICAAVDHLPLAVELAAGLTRTLTVEQIAERVHRQLRLLVGGPREAGRHASLRAAIDWSHALLPDDAKTVLRRLAVFAGGCTLEAAERVVAHEEIEDVDVAALLTELHDRCLLSVRDGRFRLLESVREYALERLRDSADEQAARGRHADWCVELSKRTQTYGGPDHPALLAELRTEEPNLRAAIGWALDNAPQAVIEIVARTWWYWWQLGQMADGRDWLRRALATTEGDATAERSAALRAAASLTRNSGYFDEARELGEQALSIATAIQDDVAIAAGLVGLCITNMAARNHEESLAQAAEAVEVARRTDNVRLLGATLNVTGGALRNLGRVEEAEQKFHEAIAVWDTVGDRRGVAGTRSSLGLVAWLKGDHATARSWLSQALAVYRELDLVEGLLDVMELYARLEVDEGRPLAALRLLTVAAERRRIIGAPLIVPDEKDARDDAERTARELVDLEPGPHTVESLVDDLLEGRPIT